MYDIKFHTLTDSYPSLHWDTRHLDTCIECISLPKPQPERWPCPPCGSMYMYHCPECCPFCAGSSSTDANGQLPVTGHATHSPDPHLPSHQHPQPPPSHTSPKNYSHSHQSADASITDAPAHEWVVSSAMFASNAMDHTLNMLTPPFKCELHNHPDKAFIRLLLSDIWLGCDIGYTGPHFTYTANNLQSVFSNPSVLAILFTQSASNVEF